MKLRLLAAAGIVAAASAVTLAQKGGMTATADIKGDKISGTATFTERTIGSGTVVDITVTVSGLTPGKHGVHLHAIGKCEPPAFTAAS